MSFERLDVLAKEHAVMQRYPGHRLHMSRALSARLMQRYKPDIGDRELIKLRDTVFGKPLLYELMGIPIINDVGITDETQWILVDSTGEEVERGNVTPAREFQWSYGPTSWDAEPGKKWHGNRDCGGEVMTFEGVHCCSKCGEYDTEEEDALNSTRTDEQSASGQQAQ